MDPSRKLKNLEMLFYDQSQRDLQIYRNELTLMSKNAKQNNESEPNQVYYTVLRRIPLSSGNF